VTDPHAAPNPAHIMEILNGYQQTYALKAAVELDLFTHIAEGADTPAALARRVDGSTRGVRILCDYLAVIGLLAKSGERYALGRDAKVFLDRQSPGYLGASAKFLAHDRMIENFRDLAATVRRGGPPGSGTLAPEDPIWVEFARSMAPMMVMQAEAVARLVPVTGHPQRVLDVAAGHGLFGLAFAQLNPEAEIVAVDWENVLQVARENAAAVGAEDRYTTIAGSAFDVDLGSGYHVILLPNFLHHFDAATNIRLLRRLRAAIADDGVVATIEFVPDENRIAPPAAAAFALTMLGSTPDGDAFIFSELDAMFREAGFGESRMQDLDHTAHRLVLTRT
jgi:2-polyprenyl-3-methyl-5-hydroxy-6-metoxy-1,4-benzoquinol methylase